MYKLLLLFYSNMYYYDEKLWLNNVGVYCKIRPYFFENEKFLRSCKRKLYPGGKLRIKPNC